jgi:hypothetical protein
MTATGKTVKIGDVEIAEHVDVFSFTIPAADKVKPEFVDRAGEKIEDLSFSFGQAADEAEAVDVCTAKEWTLVDFVNDTLRANARANAYQTELAKYKKDERDPEKTAERIVRDAMALGLTEEMARNMVKGMLASK